MLLCASTHIIKHYNANAVRESSNWIQMELTQPEQLHGSSVEAMYILNVLHRASPTSANKTTVFIKTKTGNGNTPISR